MVLTNIYEMCDKKSRLLRLAVFGTILKKLLKLSNKHIYF